MVCIGEDQTYTAMAKTVGLPLAIATLAILNSKLATFYHFNSSPKATKGAFPKILVEDIKTFPLPMVLSNEQKNIVSLVDKIYFICQFILLTI